MAYKDFMNLYDELVHETGMAYKPKQLRKLYKKFRNSVIDEVVRVANDSYSQWNEYPFGEMEEAILALKEDEDDFDFSGLVGGDKAAPRIG